MRMTVLFFALIFILPHQALAADEASFTEANRQYASGHFKEAAALYENRIASNHATAAAYYNLGNALFRAGEKGKALVAYERALEILPRDEDIRWNIGVLKSVLVDSLEPAESRFGSSIRFLTGFFTVNEAGLLFTAALAVFLLAAIAGFFFSSLGSLARLLRAVALLLGILSAVLFGLKWLDVKDPRAVVLEKETFARYGPSETEAKAFLLHEGAEARVFDETNGWLYVELPDKKSGWVRRNACDIL